MWQCDVSELWIWNQTEVADGRQTRRHATTRLKLSEANEPIILHLSYFPHRSELIRSSQSIDIVEYSLEVESQRRAEVDYRSCLRLVWWIWFPTSQLVLNWNHQLGERTPETRRRKELSDWWRVRQWRGQDGRINCRFGVNSHVSPASTRAGISPRRRGSAGRGINSRRFFLIVARQPKMSGETSALFLTHTHTLSYRHTHARTLLFCCCV